MSYMELLHGTKRLSLLNEHSYMYVIINPRCACAARVTVVVLCVCLSICLSVGDYSRTTGYEVAYERYQQLQRYKGKKKCGDFAETTAFERYGVKTS